ncbi:MAG: 23S rRNA (guanosine(2251)-2'-O)-methyltransferase RlmB, partial [Acholeplasmataceae bacterium]|nr:23S rRNA (guanosine(2251)-2'-O)-methyltransferase RlmB [Acholeplasmataceae bacterium]
LVKRNCDLLVKIPMFGKINSLNVSVAAALMMYQTLKR